MPDTKPRAVILMGVAGSGKTTVGATLAKRLGWTFLEADDFHPAANVEKMSKGIPLNDENRMPWLLCLKVCRKSTLSSLTLISLR